MARHRIGDFYGAPIATPVTIIAANAAEGRKFGLTDVPGTAFISMTGTYVTLNMEQFGLDVTAHELMHAELAKRLGYWARITQLPTWFDEGVALQLDRRAQYLIDCATVGQVFIGDQDLLMKLAIFRLHGLHHLLADSSSLKCGMNEQMRIVHNQMTVGDRVAQTDQPIFDPRRDQRMRV
jgi:hypothetical protein